MCLCSSMNEHISAVAQSSSWTKEVVAAFTISTVRSSSAFLRLSSRICQAASVVVSLSSFLCKKFESS